MRKDIRKKLEHRLGRSQALHRLGIEDDFQARVSAPGSHLLHFEHWPALPGFLRNALKLTGLYRRGRNNTARIQTRHNRIELPRLPSAFDDFTILHISDLHVDMNHSAMNLLAELVQDLEYDICVLTGDYRGEHFGPFDAALEGMARVRARLKAPVYGVLGNHDTIRMLPGLEEMGIRMLINESETIERDGAKIHFAGIDDAHSYRMDNIEKAVSEIRHDECSILLSHTPEVYHQAAGASFDLMLSGHTHGGQICLPGRIPITLDSVLPRHMGSGPWKYNGMIGYTSAGAGSSVLAVRFNCHPEITLHHLHTA